MSTTNREGGGEVAMQLDEEFTPAVRRLITLEEVPPVDAKLFDETFALLDERDHAGERRKKPDKKRPVTLEETRPEGDRA